MSAPNGLPQRQSRAIADVLRELKEEGIDPASELGEKAIRLVFERPTEHRCEGIKYKGQTWNCGNVLAKWETINGRCWSCTRGSVARMDVAQKAIDEERALAMMALADKINGGRH